MAILNERIPDAQTFLELESPELASVILQDLCALTQRQEKQLLHLSNYTGQFTGNTHTSPYPAEYWKEINRHIAEAWAYLNAIGSIAPSTDQGSHGWVFVTRLGQKISTTEGFIEYRKAMELPKDKLHPAIAERCFGHFVRGLFDAAVFEAYRALEIAIRESGNFGPTDVGQGLARKAFDPNNGVLRDKDKNSVAAERQALSDLMAGALGSYKNPHSHRNVALSPEEAVEMIILASHLLRIVDTRKKTKS